MRYECQFQMKTLLNVFLLVQRSPLAFIDYHAMLSLHKRQRERERERERDRESKYDYESTRYYQALFMKGKQNLSSLHKIICSLVSLFLFTL